MENETLKYVFIVNSTGFVVDSAVIDTSVRDFEPSEISTPFPPVLLYKPKWNGTEWTEGATQEEIDELTKVEPQPPTKEELLEQRLADLELMLVEVLSL